MFIKWPKIVKSYVDSIPAKKKNIDGPKNCMAFLRTLVVVYTIQVRIMSTCCSQCRYLPLIKAIYNTTKYAPYVRWSPGEKSNCLVQMNICALKLIIAEHDLVVFIFT